MEALKTTQHIDEALGSRRVLIYKHSTTCGRSAKALTHMNAVEKAVDTPIFIVDVLANRDVSNAIAERVTVKHESPQVILLVRGKPVWEAHHWDVTEENIKKALASH